MRRTTKSLVLRENLVEAVVMDANMRRSDYEMALHDRLTDIEVFARKTMEGLMDATFHDEAKETVAVPVWVQTLASSLNALSEEALAISKHIEEME